MRGHRGQKCRRIQTIACCCGDIRSDASKRLVLAWLAVESTLTTSPSASSRRTFGAAPSCLAVRMPSIGVKSKMQSRPPWPMSQKN